MKRVVGIGPAERRKGGDVPESISGMVNRIMADYDHNGNGVIDLKTPPPKSSSLKDQVVHALTVPDETLHVHFFESGGSQTLTHIELFRAADTDHDDKVTPDELKAAIAPYDANGNGVLESRGGKFWKKAEERQVFEKAVGERVLPEPGEGLGPM